MISASRRRVQQEFSVSLFFLCPMHLFVCLCCVFVLLSQSSWWSALGGEECNAEQVVLFSSNFFWLFVSCTYRRRVQQEFSVSWFFFVRCICLFVYVIVCCVFCPTIPIITMISIWRRRVQRWARIFCSVAFVCLLHLFVCLCVAFYFPSFPLITMISTWRRRVQRWASNSGGQSFLRSIYTALHYCTFLHNALRFLIALSHFHFELHYQSFLR